MLTFVIALVVLLSLTSLYLFLAFIGLIPVPPAKTADEAFTRFGVSTRPFATAAVLDVTFDLPEIEDPEFFNQVGRVTAIKEALAPWTVKSVHSNQFLVYRRLTLANRIRAYLANRNFKSRRQAYAEYMDSADKRAHKASQAT